MNNKPFVKIRMKDGQKAYRPVLNRRLLRRSFKRAGDAVFYADAVQIRHKSIWVARTNIAEQNIGVEAAP